MTTRQAWILRGEDRLPAALRGFGPTPRIAAAVAVAARAVRGPCGARPDATALRLRGTWDDPVVATGD